MSGDAARLRIARDRLIFMGLAVLDQIAEECHREPHRRGIALRVTMAMLYAFSDGRRGPYDHFWRICATCNSARDPQGSALQRGRAVRAAFHEICRTLNVRETGDLRANLRAARIDPGNDLRGYHAPQGAMTEDEVLRMRMADQASSDAYARNADLARERRGKECPIRG
jgi:hypothetical protein